MYINKFSTGTILALLALSGMLFLVPLAAPVHASNGSSPTVGFCTDCGDQSSPIRGTVGTWVALALANPASNQFALTAFTISAPAGWTLTSCDWFDDYIQNCATGGNSASFFFQSGSTNTPLPPGTTANPEVYVTSPSGVYPFSAAFSMTVQDQSGNNFYPGNSFSIQAIDPTSAITVTVTPGGSNSVSSYTAGSAPYSVTAKLTCTVGGNCPTGTESGVGITWKQAGYNPASTGFSFSPTSGTTLSGTGSTTTTFQPTNIAINNANPSSPTTLEAFVGVAISQESIATGLSANTITTNAGTPTSVGFTLSAVAFPGTDWLTYKGTTTNIGATTTFTGAVLCVATQQSCTGANPANTAVGISVTDAYTNPITFGAGGVTFVGPQNIQVQAASGAYFDLNSVAPLTSTITCGVTAGFACPVAGNSVPEPFNYYQGGAYATVGILTATITGTYAGSSFSVSGSSGNIETSSFGAPGPGSFLTTNHVALGANTQVGAGKTYTFEFLLPVVQSGVPVTLGICPHSQCPGTTAGYSGNLGGAQTIQLVSNSTGYVSTTLTVDNSIGHVAFLNATVANPINGAPKHTWQQNSGVGSIQTKAGSAAKFQVSVGVTQSETPSPIFNAVPGETVYVNVITTDAFGNIVTNVQSQQIQINLNANPNTVTATNIYIPQGCAMTNATTAANSHGYQCTGILDSFGSVAWTLPSTVGSVATISASGVLNGASVTSATLSINIVSASPTLSVTSPKPINGYLYTNNQNVQFQGWANASVGYNGLVTMSTLGSKIGAAHWVQNSITGVVKSQWSIIATLPANAVTQVNFNATDSKGNVVVFGTPFNVLVDLTTPTITDVTPANGVVNSSTPFAATIVAAQGDLNAALTGITYNGTALASSAITVTGTNNPGSSVTYTLTAAIPVGHWSIVVSATTLAGNTGTSTAELVNSIVTNTGSFTIVGTPSQVSFAGNPDTVAGVYQSHLAASQTIVIVASVSNSAGQQIGFATATVTIAAGSTGTFDLSFVGLTPGTHYTVKFTAYSSAGIAASVPTTVSITA